MSSYRRALSVYGELDIPRRFAQIELSLTVVSEMGGELQTAARGYGRLADDGRLSDRHRARSRLWIGTALSKDGEHGHAACAMTEAAARPRTSARPRTGRLPSRSSPSPTAELAEYLGHADPAFTLRVYAHLLPSSHDEPGHDAHAYEASGLKEILDAAGDPDNSGADLGYIGVEGIKIVPFRKPAGTELPG